MHPAALTPEQEGEIALAKRIWEMARKPREYYPSEQLRDMWNAMAAMEAAGISVEFISLHIEANYTHKINFFAGADYYLYVHGYIIDDHGSHNYTLIEDKLKKQIYDGILGVIQKENGHGTCSGSINAPAFGAVKWQISHDQFESVKELEAIGVAVVDYQRAAEIQAMLIEESTQAPVKQGKSPQRRI